MKLMNVDEISRQLATSKSEIFNLSKRENDPLPLLILKGKKRGAFMLDTDLAEWIRRNSCPYNQKDDFKANEK